jgi:hypothetical protein
VVKKEKARLISQSSLYLCRQRPTLPQEQLAVPSALRGLTSVFGMGTGGPPAILPPTSGRSADSIPDWLVPISGRIALLSTREIVEDEASQLNRLVEDVTQICASSKFYDQAERAISIGKLNVLPRLHLRPIKQVVFLCPSLPLGLGDLILEHASRLYAFSGYHNRTSLPSRAFGKTTGTQEVRPSRSSRTKDSPPQISYAHTR